MSIQANFPALKPTLLLDFANVKALDPRITFTRASTATFYDGRTFAKAEENLLLQSENFTNSTAWLTSSGAVSYTGDTSVAPNGTSTADTLTASAGTGVRQGGAQSIYAITSGLSYTASIFVKAGTDTVVQLFYPSTQFGSTAFANFDLSGGTVGTVGATATASISNAGNGWYRCSITATATGSSTAASALLFCFTGNNASAARAPSITAAGTETLLLWGAQLEQRSAVTAYTATTTQPITNYIPQLMTAANGVARFDHNPTTEESLGLLIEEQRTNLLTYSEQFDDASWTKIYSTITANTVVAPDGALTADKLVADTTTNYHTVFKSFSFTSGTAYTLSVFAKAGGYQYLTLTAGNTSTFPARVTFDLVAGTVISTVAGTGSIQSVGNGWFRCSVSATATATASTGCNIAASSTGAYVTYTGDGYSGIYIWGAQLEAGAFPTSYIPTVAAQVTRSADAASMTGTNFSSWFSNDQGTLYIEINPLALAASSGVVINDNTTNNRIRLATASTTDQGTVTTSGTAQAVLDGGTPAANTSMKLAMTYQVNNFALSLNGATAATDTAGTVPVVNQLQIGAETTTIGNLRIKKLAYYTAASTTTQLQALTS